MRLMTKGAMVGLATGVLAGAAIVKASKMKKFNNKKAERAVKSIETAVQDIAKMIKCE